MDTALPQKFPFILDRNLAKANWTENHIYTSCDRVVLWYSIIWSTILSSLEADENINKCFQLKFIFIWFSCTEAYLILRTAMPLMFKSKFQKERHANIPSIPQKVCICF